jgi:hypothetical protein
LTRHPFDGFASCCAAGRLNDPAVTFIDRTGALLTTAPTVEAAAVESAEARLYGPVAHQLVMMVPRSDPLQRRVLPPDLLLDLKFEREVDTAPFFVPNLRAARDAGYVALCLGRTYRLFGVKSLFASAVQLRLVAQ